MPGSPPVLRFQRGLPHSKQFGERLRFLVIQGEDKGVCFSLLGDLMFLGREGTQILFKDSNMSRKHAEVSWQNGNYLIRDLGSSNGIVVNGQKVPEAVLKPGDILLVGLTVIEVYPPGQVRKRDAPQITGYVSPKKAEKEKAAEELDKNSNEARKKKQEIDKKKMVIYLVIFIAVYFAFFSDDEKVQSVRERSKIDISDEDPQPKKKLTKKELESAVKEYVPNYAIETQQRKDAEVFFRTGEREKENKNYKRAINAFETALTVDPTHELAKIYLKSTIKERDDEIKTLKIAAVRAKNSLRYKESRMHYENIIRYLEGDKNNKMYVEATEAIKQLEKDEKKR